jgi:hypothetical protein
MHHVRPVKLTVLNKSLQHRERELLPKVATKPTGPSIIFGQQLGLIMSIAEDVAYGAAIMTADRQLQFYISESDARTEAATWSFAVTQLITIHPESVI